MKHFLLILSVVVASCGTPVKWVGDPDMVLIKWVKTDTQNSWTEFKNGVCIVHSPRPRYWQDPARMCLGHEVMHCFKAIHHKPTNC